MRSRDALLPLATILALALLVESAPVEVSSLVCVRATWSDLCIFLLTNYVSHAATTLSTPGGKWYDHITWRAVAVLLPFASLGRSLTFLLRWSMAGGAKDDLHSAWGRGALVVVARKANWKPRTLVTRDHGGLKLPIEKPDINAQQQHHDSFPDTVCAILPSTWDDYHPEADQPYQTARISVKGASTLRADSASIKYRKIHGHVGELPEGFGLAFSQSMNNLFAIEFDLIYGDPSNSQIQLCHDQNWVAMLVSLVQLFSSALTLYRTRGDQILRYGYAAFGLSVIPFMIMTIVNLILNAALGEYPYLYILRTEVLEECEKRRCTAGSGFQGPVGRSTDIRGRGWSGPDIQDVEMHLENTLNGEGEVLVVKANGVEKKFRLADSSASIIMADPDHPVEAQHVFKIHAIANRPAAVEDAPGRDLDVSRHRFPIPDVFPSVLLPGQRRNHRSKQHQMALTLLYLVLSLALSLPYVMIYGFSRFEKGGSSHAERVWMMVWLVLGQVYGLGTPLAELADEDKDDVFLLGLNMAILSVFLFLVPSAIGEYVQIGKMYMEFGSCSLSPS